jgi:dihydrofolate synthase/folylpolyglutamate synthase
VITNISLDHTKYLGNSIKEIAKEKAGIIKENKTVIIGETHPETKEVFIQSAIDKKSDIIFADQNNHKSYPSDLNGYYQNKNQKTVLEAIYFLRRKKFKIHNVAIDKGFNKVIQNTGLRGRWEVLSNSPLIICDTAHNKAALSLVIDQLNDYKSNKIHFILGFTDDKNLEDLSKLFPKNGVFYFVKANIERSAEPKKIQEYFAKNKRFGDTYESINVAVELAKNNTSNNEIIFVGGSSFVVSEIID